MRQDYFIIWPHGMKYVEDIITTFKNDFYEKFHVYSSQTYTFTINTFDRFIFQLYKDEDINHIREKNRFLLEYVQQEKIDPQIHVIKVYNKTPAERPFYNGSIKCENVESTKIYFRNMYNPRFKDLSYGIPPLCRGVTHNHIIHSSDISQDIIYLEKMLSLYVVPQYSIYKCDTYHFKNEAFLQYFINKYHKFVSDINDADIILSSNTSLPIEKYPTKRFIFGPHFGRARIGEINALDNTHKNAIYIQPSQPSVDLWLQEYRFTNLPIQALPFGVDTEKYIPSDTRTDGRIFVYFKNRNPEHLKQVMSFLRSRKYENIKIFNYKSGYDQDEYIKYISTCQFGIWIGSHESQGFALQECLSCNVPLFIWNVRTRAEEWGSGCTLKTPVSTVPYWDNRCGKCFYNIEDIDDIFNDFIRELPRYCPRDYVVENLSYTTLVETWNDMFRKINL